MTVAGKTEAQKRAESSIKKEERARDGTNAMQEHQAEARAIQEKTTRLRALRLAKEAAEKSEEVATQPIKPASQRRTVGSNS
jgi:hypothetical protein